MQKDTISFQGCEFKPYVLRTTYGNKVFIILFIVSIIINFLGWYWALTTSNTNTTGNLLFPLFIIGGLTILYFGSPLMVAIVIPLIIKGAKVLLHAVFFICMFIKVFGIGLSEYLEKKVLDIK